MKLKIMIGFWFQPGADVIDHVIERDPSLAPEREEIIEWAKLTGLIQDDSQLFHALLAVDEDTGLIQDTVIIDKLGPAALVEGFLREQRLGFCKHYDMPERDDVILYELEFNNKGFYEGTYWGNAVGKGLARCYIFDPDPAFFALPIA